MSRDSVAPVILIDNIIWSLDQSSENQMSLEPASAARRPVPVNLGLPRVSSLDMTLTPQGLQESTYADQYLNDDLCLHMHGRKRMAFKL